MKILVINAGSSSLKYQLIDIETEEVLAKGNYEKIGLIGSFLTHKAHGEKYKFEKDATNHEEALQLIISKLLDKECGVINSLDEIKGVGHRTVHGGEKFKNSVLIDEEVIRQVELCSELAPLHNPNAISGMKACQKVIPNAKMVAVFDTAFHQTIPEERYIYPIPYEYYKKYGIRKYGFHGISHQYISLRIAELLEKDAKDLRIVNCHLGQGASLCAIKNGKSVETTMGLTPLGGIPMGSRSGDLDPSIVTYLMKKENLSPDEMNKILNEKSGLYGVSELSIDCRDVEDAWEKGDKQSTLAIKVFCYAVAQNIAKCAVAMGGIDALTFTAGVGERGPLERKEICDYLKILGVEINDKVNDSIKGDEGEISTPNSRVKVWVVPTNEELMIAKETYKFVKNN